MRNAMLYEAQAGIKTARRNIITSYVDDTITKAERGITEPLVEGVRGE